MDEETAGLGRKRGHEGDLSLSSNLAKKTPCQYGEKCYRKNAAHFLEYSHPHLEKLSKEKGDTTVPSSSKQQKGLVSDQLKSVSKQRQSVPCSISSNSHISSSSSSFSNMDTSVATKLEAAAPYYVFLTRVTASKHTYSDPKSISFSELLDPSLGKLHSSLQMNFMVEADWLMKQYKCHNVGEKSLTIIYGVLDNGKALLPNVTVIHVKPTPAFGHHHCKLSFFFYDDKSLRIVVGTANLIESDWENRTQGVWVSPACPQLPESSNSSAGESPTGWKADLLLYLETYTKDYIKSSQPVQSFNIWVDRVRRADFSKINVFFIGSVPKAHRLSDRRKWGHLRLGTLLAQHAVVPEDESWPLVAQCSSIGSLGPLPTSWTCSELLASMSLSRNAANASQAVDSSAKSLGPIKVPAVKLAPFKLIYPTIEDVARSYDGLAGGGCLPYSKRTHDKQEWLASYMHKWRSNHTHRTRAMPHIKTYARLSSCGKKMAWFHLTSANLSKAAWGTVLKDKTALSFMSYEAGVLFLPTFVLSEKDTEFDLTKDNGFPVPYDLPLTAYDHDDAPWFMDVLQAMAR